MAFVESVVGEFFQKVEDGRRFFLRDVIVLPAPGDEVDPLLGHLLLVLFAHGAAQEIGLPQAVASQQVRRLLHLFLVNEDAVGLLGNLFKERMVEIDLRLALLALDVVGDERHGTRTVKGAERVHVVETVEAEITAVTRHATFKLEDSDRFTPVEHIESRLVVDRDFLDVKPGNVPPDQLLGVADDGQGFQAEKIHFEHAQIAERVHGELGHDLVFLPAAERNNLGKITVADDHSGGVDTGVARQALEHRGVAPQLLGAGFGLDGLLQLRVLLLGRGERDVQLVGDHFGDAVTLPVAHAENPGHVTYHALGPQLVESHDLGDAALPVFLPHVFDHLSAARLAEVDVNIRGTDPLRIQKPLENESVTHRIEVRDAEHIRHHASRGRTAARSDRNSALLGVMDEVPDDEEIAGEAELFEDTQFVIEPFVQLRSALPVATAESLAAEFAQVTLAGPALGRVKNREPRLSELHRHIAAVSDARSIRQRLRVIPENFRHFRRGLQIELG